MLVLTRKLGESIVVPSLGLTIQVVAVKGGHVRLGITAPREVQIIREELLHEDVAQGEDGKVRSKADRYLTPVG